MSTRVPLRPARKVGVLHGVESVLVIGLLLLGAIARLLPFTDPSGRMLRQYPSEDGYLMQTIARNIAIGHGMSTAEGTIPTNGIQPLATLLYALGFRVVGADRVAGVAVALGLQLAAALVGAWVIYRLARRIHAPPTHGTEAARLGALAGAIWFASPHAIVHGMNCLETGFYALGVALFAWAFLVRHSAGGGKSDVRAAAFLGLLAGLVLWVRLDAVFLLAAACLAWAFLDGGARLRWSAARLREAVAMGAVAVATIGPWLFYNRARFGSFVPISGRAEASFSPGLGSHLAQVPANLAEYLLLVVPIPGHLERHPIVVSGSILLILLAVVLLARGLRSATPAARVLAAVAAVFALGLSGYYGSFFGAPYFFTRYLFPLSVFTAIAWSAAWLSLAGARRSAAMRIALPGALVAGLLVLHVRLYRGGMDHLHFQVVEWVEENVPDGEWVGAVQTGAVGYFHDRTINLDGKVNPEAFAALQARRIPSYVLEKPIRYLADWEGLARWAELPELRGRFEVVVHDPGRNLAVLERRN